MSSDEPAGSLPFPAATAVEVVTAQAPAGFLHGILVGIACAAVAVQGFLAYELASFRDMYRDFGGGLPQATRLVLTGAWRWGVPAAGALIIAALVALRPRSSWPYIAVAVVMVVTAIATWYIARMPVYELAGNIQPD